MGAAEAFEGLLTEAFAYPGEAGQDGHAGQHHLLGDEVRCGQVEEDARADRTHGELGVEPPDQAERQEVVEWTVLRVGQDDRLVFVPGADPPAVTEENRRIDLELNSQGLKDVGGNLARFGEEGAQEAQGTELKGAAEFVVVTSTRKPRPDSAR